MRDDDIAFVEGYIDAIGWMPTAKPGELVEFVCLSLSESIWFEMEEDHGLAEYKGWTNNPGDGIIGIMAAKFDERGVEIGYTAGINAALRIHRPDVVREASATVAKFRADMAAMDQSN
jgi:hypothetical protein